MVGIKFVFGGATINPESAYKNADDVREAMKVLKEHSINNIDTAQLYGPSEQILGEAKAGSEFIIDTKSPGGFSPDTSSKENIIQQAHESIKKLGLDKLDIFYLHAPSSNEPNEDILDAVNEVYKAGLFQRFGLSNFKASDVQKIYDFNAERGWIKPSVYQGNYSAVARRQDTELLPTLRKLGIAFYAYSPIAGGFLSKSKEQVQAGHGRYSSESFVGKLYNLLYAKPEFLEALDKWDAIANEAGITKADLAYRWVTYNSALKPECGDAVIVGSSSLDQLKQTLQGLNAGPLPADIVTKIDDLWETIKHVAPLDNYHDGVKALQQ